MVLTRLYSAIAPSATIASEEAVSDTIKKRLVAAGPDGTDKAVKFAMIMGDLQRGVLCGGHFALSNLLIVSE